MQLLTETQRKHYLDIWHRDNGISSSGLKVIACISMLISHIVQCLSLIHISEPTRREWLSRMPSSA